jgi:alkylation response protein AidB-like acyl-CoA dehydrogenase
MTRSCAGGEVIVGHRTRWLPDLATGKQRAGVALTEPEAGSKCWVRVNRAGSEECGGTSRPL